MSECVCVQIRDMLSGYVSHRRRLEVRQKSESNGGGNYVPELTTVTVEALEEVLQLMALAEEHRASGCTNLNEHSSRSHMILSVCVESRNLLSGIVSQGKLVSVCVFVCVFSMCLIW